MKTVLTFCFAALIALYVAASARPDDTVKVVTDDGTVQRVPLAEYVDGLVAAKSAADYAAAYKSALAAGKPLVVFVGVPRRDLPGAVAVRDDYRCNFDFRGVIVGTPCDGGFVRTLLPGTPSDAEIRAVCTPAAIAAPSVWAGQWSNGGACRT